MATSATTTTASHISKTLITATTRSTLVSRPTPTTPLCSTCSASAGDDGGDDSTTWTQLTTTYSIPTASWVLSASQPVCTWEFHCLGDFCDSNDSCDNDWICMDSICQPCCFPSPETTTAVPSPVQPQPLPSASQPSQSHGLGLGAIIAIAVAVPVCIAVALGIAFLVWRSKRRKRGEQLISQNDGSDDYRKAELEAPGIPLKDIKRVEMDGDSHARAELEDNVEVAAEVHSLEPVELEDTSAYGQQKYDPMRVSDPSGKMSSLEDRKEANEAIRLYRGSTAGAGVLPSPSPTAFPPRNAPSPPPDWPLGRDQADPRQSTQSSGYQVSPESSTPRNLRTSPVSTASPYQARRPSQQSTRQSLSPMLPEGMIDRFEMEEDEDDDLSPGPPRRPSYFREAERGRHHTGPGREPQRSRETTRSGQEYVMFRWPTPPGQHERPPG